MTEYYKEKLQALHKIFIFLLQIKMEYGNI